MRVIEACIRDIEHGEDVTIMMPSNVYECELGDNVFVGPFVEIQKQSKIGARTRVQSHSFICEMVSIGEDCLYLMALCLLMTHSLAEDQRGATKINGTAHQLEIVSQSAVMQPYYQSKYATMLS